MQSYTGLPKLSSAIQWGLLSSKYAWESIVNWFQTALSCDALLFWIP